MNRLIMNQAVPIVGRHEGHSDGSGVGGSQVGNCEGDTGWAAGIIGLLGEEDHRIFKTLS